MLYKAAERFHLSPSEVFIAAWVAPGGCEGLEMTWSAGLLAGLVWTKTLWEMK